MNARRCWRRNETHSRPHREAESFVSESRCVQPMAIRGVSLAFRPMAKNKDGEVNDVQGAVLPRPGRPETHRILRRSTPGMRPASLEHGQRREVNRSGRCTRPQRVADGILDEVADGTA